MNRKIVGIIIMVVGCSFPLLGLLLCASGAKYEVPGNTVIVTDGQYQEPFDPCDVVYKNLYTPSSDWLIKHGNSERSMLLFNLSYARRRADMNFQLIKGLEERVTAVEPNDPNE